MLMKTGCVRGWGPERGGGRRARVRDWWRVAGVTALAVLAAAPAAAGLSRDEALKVQDIMADMHEAVFDNYYPKEKVGKEFKRTCAEAEKRIGGAADNSEAFATIADALASLDPRIMFWPPRRAVRVDYSWQWMMLGDAAYVTEVDRAGDAAKQGLRLGDQVLSIEGVTPDRGNCLRLDYTFNVLAPRPGLRIQVQSPGQPPRWLAIAATIRPQRPTRTRTWLRWASVVKVYSERDRQYLDAVIEQKNRRWIGRALVWHLDRLEGIAGDRAAGLRSVDSDAAAGLKEAVGAGALILDLRGQYLVDVDRVMQVLDGLFVDEFEVGKIKNERWGKSLRVRGRSDAFKGTVLVLTDSHTGGFAELLAHVIQQRQRGVIIGDRTMGRVFEESFVSHARGLITGFIAAGVTIPTGELILADGTPLDGRGVAPDLLLLPQPEDLAARRDVVLAKALRMVKETLSPEDAFKLFWIDPDYED